MKKNYASILTFLIANLSITAQGGFTKIVNPSNPITTYMSPGIYKGVSWVDFDNDNDLDLFASPNFLFRNDGNEMFAQITNPFDFEPLQAPGGASWADINNDGFMDCIISQNPAGIFLGNSGGTFTNITSQYSSLTDYPAWGCAIGNWNNDAFPDFVFVHAAGFHGAGIGPFPSKLFLNTSATAVAEQITGYQLTDETHPYTVPYWSDYDLDGDMDLFVASGPGGTPGPDFCYKNMKIENGSDTFEPMTTELFATQLQDGQCYNFIDFDNDQDLDLCLTNYGGASTRFYRNSGGVYTLQTTPFTTQTTNLANDWGDFDNDGDLDVIITNDMSKPKFYKNNGNGTFATAISLGTVNNSSGITNGDYDNDGDLDLFVSGVDATRALYKNTSAATGNNWITIKCVGTTSNKSALGTLVKLRATINGVDTWQMREITAQNSFQSQNDLRVHFGLGNATTIQTLSIKYPSGILETFSNVGINTFYSNIENSGNLLAVESNEIQKPFSIYPNPAKGFLNITFDGNVEEPLKVSLIDMKGKLLKTINYQIEGNSIKIPTDELNIGTYLIKIEGQSFNYSTKFIKSDN
ncbi:FG-GAP-like repeat-containing protein [Flavobacterium wongokense]|uniref:FG-GAP-like repeat-containing protein n=1 Tax=Flavobacterium wongokense TaxID=2910674 RepID=UPI001F1F0990|nr:FG-GAP-like repeat-containing protein [Flavobacterium sp. WG47]MCF6133382.1 FG-GAP-like repeat-containing protein [Flavobacterium sp. WG47]